MLNLADNTVESHALAMSPSEAVSICTRGVRTEPRFDHSVGFARSPIMYRDELAALRAREEAVAREIASRQQELDEIRRTIDGLKPRLRLRLASPCPVDWNTMQGDERVRFCKLCERNVYNLSAMKHVEVQELMREKEGKLCVRFYQRADGTVMTRDCPVGKRERRRRSILMTAGAAGAAGLLAAASAGFVRMERVDDIELPQPALATVMTGPLPPEPTPPPITARPAKYVIVEKAPTIMVGEIAAADSSTPPSTPEPTAAPSSGLTLPHSR